MARYRMFERQFHFVSHDYRHRPLLQHAQRAGFSQAVGGQLLALERVEFIAESCQADFRAGRDEGERIEFVSFLYSSSGPDGA